jgi:hypothetical protein
MRSVRTDVPQWGMSARGVLLLFISTSKILALKQWGNVLKGNTDLAGEKYLLMKSYQILLRSQLNARFLDFLASYLTDRGLFTVF